MTNLKIVSRKEMEAELARRDKLTEEEWIAERKEITQRIEEALSKASNGKLACIAGQVLKNVSHAEWDDDYFKLYYREDYP